MAAEKIIFSIISMSFKKSTTRWDLIRRLGRGIFIRKFPERDVWKHEKSDLHLFFLNYNPDSDEVLDASGSPFAMRK